MQTEIGGRANIGLSKSGRAMLIYSILDKQKKNLKFLGNSDGNVDVALNIIKEIKKHGVNLTNLKEVEKSTENKYLKTKLQDITQIYEAYEGKIASKHIDEDDVLTILAKQLRRQLCI